MSPIENLSEHARPTYLQGTKLVSLVFHVKQVDKALREKNYGDILDPTLKESQPPAESVMIVLRIANQCVESERSLRPEMSQVIKELEFAILKAEGEESTVDSSCGIPTSSTHPPGMHTPDRARSSDVTPDEASCSYVNSDQCEIEELRMRN